MDISAEYTPDDKDEQQDSPHERQQEEEVQEQLQREFYDNDDIPPETFPDDLKSMTGATSLCYQRHRTLAQAQDLS